MDEERFMDEAPPTEDDMISKSIYQFLNFYRDPLHEASSLVRIQELRRVPCGPLQTLVAC
jgi:hypothetical protein